MKMSYSGRKLGQMLIAPAVVALISLSLLFGYANGRMRAGEPLDLFAQGQNEYGKLQANPQDNPKTLYSQAVTLLKQRYYGPPITEAKLRQLTYDSIRGMLLSLRDPFTSFLDPDEWSQFQATTTRGDFFGIGIILAVTQNQLYPSINEVIENGPAEKVGLMAKDNIVAVDGISVAGKSSDDVVKMIKGPEGTKVRITVVRGKQKLNFTIVRARVIPPIVRYWMEDSKYKIGHIQLEEFNEQSMAQLNHAFAALQSQGMRALVFDLRYNPGGLLDVAVQVASVFIPKNSVPALKNSVVYIHEGDGEEHARKLEQVDTPYKNRLPLVVLVNDGSASASEIVTGSIKDYGAGTIMGERTYGKGCVQTLYPLDDGSCLRLTTALYYPPKHYDINYEQDENHNRIPGTGGLLPNIPIVQPPTWDSFTDKKDDTQLHAALDFLRDRLNGMTIPQSTASVDSIYQPQNTKNTQLDIAAGIVPAPTPNLAAPASSTKQ